MIAVYEIFNSKGGPMTILGVTNLRTRNFRLSILAIGVCICLAQVEAASAYVAYDFENYAMPLQEGAVGSVPSAIQSDPNGNRYLRLTASPQDCGWGTFATDCPTTRAELKIGQISRSASNTATYSFSYRLNSSTPPQSIIAQLYQTNDLWGTPDIIGGWTVASWADADNNEVGIVVKSSNPYTCDESGRCSGAPGEQLTWPLTYDQWVHVSLNIYFHLDAGSVDITVDGQYRGTIRGRTILHLTISEWTYAYIDVYGRHAIVDFDNVVLAAGSSPSTPTPTPRPTPQPSSNAVSSNLTDYQTISGSWVVWTASATGVPSQVDFLIDNVVMWTESYAPYQFNGNSPEGYLNSTAMSDGQHTLTVRARYSDGSSAQKNISVAVSNGTPAPVQIGHAVSSNLTD